MGDEFAQSGEWKFDRSLDWHLLEYKPHSGVQQLVEDLNQLYKCEPALHEVDFEWQGFEWLDLMMLTPAHFRLSEGRVIRRTF